MTRRRKSRKVYVCGHCACFDHARCAATHYGHECLCFDYGHRAESAVVERVASYRNATPELIVSAWNGQAKG